MNDVSASVPVVQAFRSDVGRIGPTAIRPGRAVAAGGQDEHGYDGSGSERAVEPFVIAGSRTDLSTDPRISDEGYLDGGLNEKYGVTESFTADFTFNTDFAQVEVDEQQVNLTRFSLSFPEKREFYLESRGIFDFGLSAGGGGGGGGGGAPTLFYSRRIGLEGAEVVPILAGGRLTGKVGEFDLGVINIQTDDAPSIDAEGTNFTVFRLRRDIFPRSSVGALFQNRSRSVLAPGASNQAGGIDGFLGLSDEVSSATTPEARPTASTASMRATAAK